MTWPVWLSKFSFRSVSLNETSDGVNKLNFEKATQATEIRDELNAGKWNLSSSFTSPAEFQIENAVFFSVHSQTSRCSYNGSNGNKNYIAYLCCRAHIKSCDDFLIWMVAKLWSSTINVLLSTQQRWKKQFFGSQTHLQPWLCDVDRSKTHIQPWLCDADHLKTHLQPWLHGSTYLFEVLSSKFLSLVFPFVTLCLLFTYFSGRLRSPIINR